MSGPGLLLLLCHPSFAGPPVATILPNLGVEGSVSVRLLPTEARARLADPVWVSRVDGGATTVTLRAREGACVIADYTSPSALMTVRYTVRQCPTQDGVRSELVSSADFATYLAEWVVVGEGDGSLLTYRIHVEPRLPIPVRFITGTIRRDVLAMMQHFHTQFGVPMP